MAKTNAMRLLDVAKIEYKVKEYQVDEDKLGGVQVAHKLEMPADEVFKTLVARGDKNGVNIFCIPINCELDLKKAALVSKNKKIEMLAMKEVLPITGYMVGACSPIGMKKDFPLYVDETAILFDEIGVSAGIRGCEIIVNGEKLCYFVNGVLADLTL